jgi:hypothetical protein
MGECHHVFHLPEMAGTSLEFYRWGWRDWSASCPLQFPSTIPVILHGILQCDTYAFMR